MEDSASFTAPLNAPAATFSWDSFADSAPTAEWRAILPRPDSLNSELEFIFASLLE